jgi:predicted nuclease of predicted toxin-antitoxin system
MKILLDENVTHRLRPALTGHDVFTVGYMEWKGLRNGRLLQVAAAEGFDVIVTLDAGMPDQHNPATLPLAILVLRIGAATQDRVIASAPLILAALKNLKPRTVVIVP